jgi:hypothetical protein
MADVPSSLLPSAAAFRNSAALPNENARRSLEGFLPPRSFRAVKCWAAGLVGAGALFFDDVLRVALTVDAKESFVTVESALIVAGFDNGDVTIVCLVALDDELRIGIEMLVSRSCCNVDVGFKAGLFVVLNPDTSSFGACPFVLANRN